MNLPEHLIWCDVRMLHDSFYAEKNVLHTAKNSDKPVYTFEKFYCGGSLWEALFSTTYFTLLFLKVLCILH